MNTLEDRFDREWKRAEPVILGLCRKLERGKEEEAQELLQITRVRAWRGFERYSGAYKFSTWAAAIAANAKRDLARKAKRGPQTVSLDAIGLDNTDPWIEFIEDESRPFDELILSDIAAGQLMEKIPGHRRRMILGYLQTGSYRDLAIAVGVPEGTIKSRLYRCRDGFTLENGEVRFAY